MTDDTQRTLGEHGARIDTLEGNLRSIAADVREIRDTLAQARGGWKTLMLVGGAAGAVGALLGKLSTVIPFLKP